MRPFRELPSIQQVDGDAVLTDSARSSINRNRITLGLARAPSASTSPKSRSDVRMTLESAAHAGRSRGLMCVADRASERESLRGLVC
jgi:hypothetical protein